MVFKVKTVYDIVTAAVKPGRNYVEIDGMRLIFEDGQLHGWYACGYQKSTETEQSAPSEEGVV